MTLRFDSRQGLVLDQALALYLRRIETGEAITGATPAELADQAEQIRSLQAALRQAHHPRRKP